MTFTIRDRCQTTVIELISMRNWIIIKWRCPSCVYCCLGSCSSIRMIWYVFHNKMMNSRKNIVSIIVEISLTPFLLYLYILHSCTLQPSVDLTCDSGSSPLYVNTKNCSCKNYPCKNPAIVSSNEISTNYNQHRR